MPVPQADLPVSIQTKLTQTEFPFLYKVSMLAENIAQFPNKG